MSHGGHGGENGASQACGPSICANSFGSSRRSRDPARPGSPPRSRRLARVRVRGRVGRDRRAPGSHGHGANHSHHLYTIIIFIKKFKLV